MKKAYPFVLLLACLSLWLTSCSTAVDPADQEQAVVINAAERHQTIVGFGASDCWSPAYVGKHWTHTRDSIARLLFAQDIADGQPQGIGLSMWRVNLGGGSTEQGDDSRIVIFPRRAESFLAADGRGYDWDKCEGQRYFLDQAVAYGCPCVILFSNSPLVGLTKNGRAFSDSGGHSNLRDDAYDAYAAYMADVAAHYLGQGVPVTHISPINEPQWKWADPTQEGSGWTNAETSRLLRALDTALTERGLDVDILPGEAGDWEYLYREKDDPDHSRVIAALYDPSSPDYVGDLPHLKHLVCGHSYWTDGTWDGMREVRRQVAAEGERLGVTVWQSEWSMLGDGYSPDEYVGHRDATQMDIALYMSKVIHNDLTVANVPSWCFWTSMDVCPWGHQCRFVLIGLQPGQAEPNETGDHIMNEGTFQAARTLWTLGNYSLFVRPGYQRIGLAADESRHFFGSAYLAPDGKRIVAIYSNLTDQTIGLSETHDAWPSRPKAVHTYTTTATLDLAEATIGRRQRVVLQPQSVTTVVYDLR